MRRVWFSLAHSRIIIHLTDAMQLNYSWNRLGVLLALRLSKLIWKEHYWCLSVKAHYTLPSFPGDIKGKLNLKVVIITSHLIDFEHLIEYPQLCLWKVACMFSEPPPLPNMAVYMPLETASMRLLRSHSIPHRPLSVRSLVPCVYIRSRWSNPLMSFCQYYLVEHSSGPWQGRRIYYHSRHHWKYLWRTLVPEGRRTYS
jgi:hypothetical protein